MRQNWPAKLWLVRHGQSQGNVARDAADEAGLHEIAIDVRDVDVPLSALGHEQAEATGRWFAALPPDERPEVILSSPYLRARQTAEAICKAGGLSGPVKLVIDERLARAGVRNLRPAHADRHPAEIPGGGRAPLEARQILPSSRRAARAGPT